MNECVCYSMLSVTMPSHDPVFLPVYMGVCVRARVACSSLANHSMPPLPQGGAHCAPRQYKTTTDDIALPRPSPEPIMIEITSTPSTVPSPSFLDQIKRDVSHRSSLFKFDTPEPLATLDAFTLKPRTRVAKRIHYTKLLLKLEGRRA
jgi:hypothetical protein